VRELPDRLPREQAQPTVQQSRQDLERASQEVRRYARRKPARLPEQPLRVGDAVEITTLGGEGEVTGFSDDGLEADVQMGAFKVRQPVALLKRIGGRRKVEPPRHIPIPPPRRDVDIELHLRGQRAAGVDQIVDDYLHDAYLSRLPFVRIVHGRGSGALREVVRQVVAKHPLVERFETPPPYEGGDGVTVVYLREA
jgi:DNA mismatch repair protein MutS2